MTAMSEENAGTTPDRGRNIFGSPEDNVGHRLGVGIAVSIGLNSILVLGLPKPPPLPRSSAAARLLRPANPPETTVGRRVEPLRVLVPRPMVTPMPPHKTFRSRVNPTLQVRSALTDPARPESASGKPPRVVIVPRASPTPTPKATPTDPTRETTTEIGRAISLGALDPAIRLLRQRGSAADPGEPAAYPGEIRSFSEPIRSGLPSPVTSRGESTTADTVRRDTEANGIGPAVYGVESRIMAWIAGIPGSGSRTPQGAPEKSSDGPIDRWGAVRNGEASPEVRGGGRHSVVEGIGDGGNAARSTVGGAGEPMTESGTQDGAVRVGKIGGEEIPLSSSGSSDPGAVALRKGHGGNDPFGGGPLGIRRTVAERPDRPWMEQPEEPVFSVNAPHPVHKPVFRTPESLRRRRVRGILEARTTIKKNGRTEITLLKSSGDPEADQVVLEYLRGWTWEPARQNGEAIDCVRLVRFRIE
ncbi:MAG: energy transducer TonB [Capsulimonadales bacterium]|nr:energy transducer TonB [Capsulimonadales bacterium]